MPPRVQKPKTSQSGLALRLANLPKLLDRIGPLPEGFVTGERILARKNDSGLLECLRCEDYRTLVQAWRKAMKWTSGLDKTLSAMLAVVISTPRRGEQLWIKVIGPPSCGKTTLLEGVAVNSKYVFSKDGIRGFTSGYKTPDGEDNSLIKMVRGKTLATKDGDTLLKAPNLAQILSEARAIYDRNMRTHYRNAEQRDHLNVRMTWILCGTHALREIDESELGARFIDVVVMEGIDEDFEDEVGWRVANQEDRNVNEAAEEDVMTQYSPELAEAMQLTGGYVGYLCENADELLNNITTEEASLRTCALLGTFIAYMRARPSKNEELAEREFAPRLIKQQVRLAKMLAAVLNRTGLDGEVMDRVKQMALDTSRGITLQIVQQLHASEKGCEWGAIAYRINRKDEDTRRYLRFLRHIKVVEIHNLVFANGTKSNRKVYQLTDRVRRLWEQVQEL